MNRTVIIVIVLLIVAGGAYFAGKNGLTVSFNKTSPTPTPQLVGNDRDAHGCIPSAGYSWCDSKQKCIRSWEEPCSSPTPAANENETIIAAVKVGLIAEHGQDAANMTITISKIEGDYAKGMANEQGGGGIWFAAKVNGNWKLVWDGNGIIQCTDLTAYPNFPADLIPSCWDTVTDKLITR